MKLSNVYYRYGSKGPDAVADVTIAFGPQPALILGVNGAGKSTLLRIMAKQLVPQAGNIDRPRALSIVPQTPIAVRGLTVEEQIGYAAWLKGVKRSHTAEMVRQAISTVAIDDLAQSRTNHLSGGQLARLGIACGLVGEVQMLMLDEPSASLDPLARRSIHDVLDRIADNGVQIIATSHTAADLGPPFERIVVMDKGRVVHDGARARFLEGAHDHPVVRELARVLRSEVAP